MNFSESIRQVSHLIDLWLPLKIQYEHVPGVSLGITYKGTLVYQKGIGFADVEQRRRATEETLYHVASISKVFTALAVLQLVERGKLRLDDKVVHHLDWFRTNTRERDAAHITIRQLLSHASGIFRDGDTPLWETGKFPKDLQFSFSRKSLRMENLTGFKYSNYGFALLGMVIEKVSGVSYASYVQENILWPLRMRNTVPDYRKGLPYFAAGYGRMLPNTKRRKFPHYKTNAYMSATGFISNVVDLARFLSVFSLERRGAIISRESRLGRK